MEKFSNTHYERLQSDDESEENVDEDLPPQVHITAPGGDGSGRNGEIFMLFKGLSCLNLYGDHFEMQTTNWINFFLTKYLFDEKTFSTILKE